MPEHFTLATVSSEFWCGKCKKMTQHRIDTRRKGPCLECIARLEAKKSLKVSETKIKFEEVHIGPMCICLAFDYPHEAIMHFRCLNQKEKQEWEMWVNAGNQSCMWSGWGKLGKRTVEKSGERFGYGEPGPYIGDPQEIQKAFE